MKIIHTSDWHLGQTLRSYDREDEHRHFLSQLQEILRREQPQALVVSGDVFHTSLPGIGAQSLLVEALRNLHRACPSTAIILIAGNHDSGSRLEIHRDLWLEHNIHFVGRFDARTSVVRLPEGVIVAVPYSGRAIFVDKESDLTPEQAQKAAIEEIILAETQSGHPLIIAAHAALTSGKSNDIIGGLESKALSSMPEGYDYLAMGHIHMPHLLSPRAAYCGSPIPLTFDEEYRHYVNIVEITTHGAQPQIRKEEIRPLREVITLKANDSEQAMSLLQEHPLESEAYLRVVIDTPELLPADIDDRARMALKGHKCRFCGCYRLPRFNVSSSEAEGDELEIEDFLQIAPIDIARRYFEDENIPDAPQLLELLTQVIDKLNPDSEL